MCITNLITYILYKHTYIYTHVHILHKLVVYMSTDRWRLSTYKIFLTTNKLKLAMADEAASSMSSSKDSPHFTENLNHQPRRWVRKLIENILESSLITQSKPMNSLS